MPGSRPCPFAPLSFQGPAWGFVPGSRFLCRPFVQAWAEAVSPTRPLLALGLFFLRGVLAFVLTLCFWPFG